ncbi:hypothetical protein [Streptomyces aurantiogriseus]|uniref:Lipoprotein n=1 Tax=Streptomyces aurantiogriseus TaxID=66870 RepID=A0A918KX76_9ACTN|nr:hypothetical protein [Streptomyces aurantiogriseus]GGR39147.1 hypothetical protein GCM10010251_64820 [Streptomyces aurantiogriseus]
MPKQATPTRHRARLLAAALTCAAALTLTACHDGEGLRDEGPSESGTYGLGEAPARSHAEPPSGNS